MQETQDPNKEPNTGPEKQRTNPTSTPSEIKPDFPTEIGPNDHPNEDPARENNPAETIPSEYPPVKNNFF